MNDRSSLPTRSASVGGPRRPLSRGAELGGIDESGFDGWRDGRVCEGSTAYKGPINRRIVRIDVEGSIKKVTPLVRHFRENGVFTEISFSRLLSRMCSVCEVPTYKPNKPVFSYDPNSQLKALYLCEQDLKKIEMDSLQNLRGFLGGWYLYLHSRNDGFRTKGKEYVSAGGTFPERKYAKKVMKESEPKQVLRLGERSHIEEVEI